MAHPWYVQLGELHRLIYDFGQAASYHQQGIDAIGEHFLGLDNLYRLGLARHYMGHAGALRQINQVHKILANNNVIVGVIAAKIYQALVRMSCQ